MAFNLLILSGLLATQAGCTRSLSKRQADPAAYPSADPASVTVTPTLEAVTLRSLAQARHIWVGTAVAVHPLDNDPSYAQLLRKEFNILTPENDMKFEVVHPEPDRYDFSGADEIVAFARQNGMLVRGHTLVWDNQLPEWVVNGTFSRSEWLSLLQNHIYMVAGHFRGKVAAWDVVNEALDDQGGLRDTIWLRAIGPEYIALAFRWAHEADPDALLFYNENGAEGLNRKSQAVYALVKGLREAGVPVHGVGFQMHTWLGGPPPKEELLANMERLGELGLQVQITEMDVRIQYSQQALTERLALQAEEYRTVFGACLDAPNCTAFLTWGATDRYSWIPYVTGKPDAPLLFDEAGVPKAAYYSLVELMEAE